MSILIEIRELMSTLFQEFNFSFASRSCNKVAHMSAKHMSQTKLESGGGLLPRLVSLVCWP